MQNTEIAICEGHQEKEQTPLIRTFVFPYAEYRCPTCGRKYGMLGVPRVKRTLTLAKRLRRYKEKSRSFLNSNGTFNCVYFYHKGQRITPSEMPERMKKRHRSNIKKYQYKFK